MRRLTFSAAGDTIFLQKPPQDYTGWKDVADFLSRGDVRMNNMENVLSDYDCCASTYCGGTWLCAPPQRLQDLQDCFQFNCFSFANNHTLDYFYSGLSSTLNAFRCRNLPVCGAGETLTEATRHCTVHTDHGSVALLAITTTCDDAARAGDAKAPIPARPGVNKLRHQEQFRISQAHMAALREIAAATCIDGRADNSRKGGYLPTKPGIFPFGGAEFKVGLPEGKESIPNPYDMARMEAAVQFAKQATERVVVYVHSHEIRGIDDRETDYFLDTFCHACIDWGADAVIGSGTHQVKAVEFYRGAPIFYSIANFIFQVNDADHMPIDYYEKVGADTALSAAQAIAVRSKNGTIGLDTESCCYRSILPLLSWKDGALESVIAKPLGLGFDGPRHLKGLPRSATEDETALILQQLRQLSTPYGTYITLREDGLLEFRPHP